MGIGGLQGVFESLDVDGNLFSGFNAFFNGVGGDVLEIFLNGFGNLSNINEVVFEVNSFKLFGFENGAEFFDCI